MEGRRRLAEYLLRAPFSLEKITWKKETGTVIYRSKRSWNTKRNFEVFSAADFLAAAVEHIPPKNQHTVRYYGLYSNKRRGMDAKARRPPPKLCCAAASATTPPAQPTLTILPPPVPKSTRTLRPLWRDLIMRVWGADPLICPCCKGTMKVAGTMIRQEEVEFFLRLHGMWEGIIALPPPPDPPYDIEKRRGSEAFWTQAKPEPAGRARQAGRANQTMEPLAAPPQWGWTDETEAPPPEWWSGVEPAWEAPELQLDEDWVLVLDGDPDPGDEWPVYSSN